MKLLIITVLLILSKSALAYDHSVAIGQWAVYQKNYLSSDFYYFLNINSDFSGVLVRYYGDRPITRKFESSSVTKRDGYFEVQLNPREKVVFSAWKLHSGSGKLTGQILMYKEDGELLNMLYFPLQFLKSNHEFLGYEPIKELSTTYR